MTPPASSANESTSPPPPKCVAAYARDGDLFVIQGIRPPSADRRAALEWFASNGDRLLADAATGEGRWSLAGVAFGDDLDIVSDPSRLPGSGSGKYLLVWRASGDGSTHCDESAHIPDFIDDQVLAVTAAGYQPQGWGQELRR